MPNPPLMQAVLALINAESETERKRVLESQRDVLLTDDAEQLLNGWLAQSAGDYAHTLRECLTLLARCRKEGIKSPHQNRPRRPREKVRQAIFALVEANNARQRQQLIQQQQDILLSDAADEFLASWIENEEDFEEDEVILNLRDCHTLLAKCRDEGIKAAFAHHAPSHPSPSAQLTAELAALLNEIEQLTSRQQMPRRIELCREALTFVIPEFQPQLWGALQSNLGESLFKNPLGDRAENLEKAMFHYRQSLTVCTNQAFPEEWAAIMNNWAAVYRNRIRGEKANNLEEAIKYYKRALIVYTRQAFPQKWACTMHNLANAYSDRIRGARGENLEEAIRNYAQALTVYTRKAFPQEWASTINNLGETYRNRIRGAIADNLEQAICHCRQALTVRTRQAFPAEWAETMNNLANAYLYRIRGARADNLEQAISYYKQALTVYTCQTFPAEWAQTMNNLGEVYRNRIREVRADNLEQAISYYKQALTVRTRQAFPVEWAMTINNLANAYCKRIQEAKTDNLEQAIYHYRQALTVRTRNAFPAEYAMTMNNLANAYFERIRGERADNLEQAISNYRLALNVRTRQAFPTEWGETMNNLAIAYSKRIKGERADNLEQAIRNYTQALLEYTPLIWPQRCRDTAYALGRLLYDEERLAKTREAFVIAHKAVEALRGEVTRDGGRRKLALENADMYARLVFCCLHDADEDAAFEYAAAGKGRAFVDMLGSARFDLFAAEANDPILAADLQAYRELRQQIDHLRTRLTGRGTGIDEEQRKQEWEALRNLQQQELERWEDLAYKYPALTATQSAPSLSVEAAQALATDLGATLVEFVLHAGGWSAFVVTSKTLHHVPLSDVNDKFLQEMVIEWLNHIEHPKHQNEASYLALDEWYKALIMPLKPYLPPSGRVMLASAGVLHLMPLSIARNPESKRYLCDEYALSFAPSLAALRVTLEEARKKGMTQDESLGTLLAVAYPGELGQSNYLSHVVSEAKRIDKHFLKAKVTRLYRKAATPQAVVEKAKGQAVAHFSCHGTFDSNLPEQSGLALSGGYLTVQRIITELNLSDARLATLSACVTHRADLRAGEEHVGLVQSVLTAGAQAVVASLWSVPERATRVLFEQFYGAVANGKAPAQALTEAMRHVRQQPGWEHPFYWAAFQVSGLGYELEMT